MNDWRFVVDELRSDIRKARTEGVTQVTLDNLETEIDRLASACEVEDLKEVKSESEDEELKRLFKEERESITHLFEHSKQYTNVIVIGGYAGLFTVWSFTKDAITSNQSLIVGLGLLLSLFFYIGFELYSSYVRSSQIITKIKELENAESKNSFPEEYGKSIQAQAARFGKIWPWLYFATLLCALASAVVLGYSFVIGLFQGP